MPLLREARLAAAVVRRRGQREGATVQAELSRDFVAAVAVVAGGASLTAAAADGRLSLLDARGPSPLIAQARFTAQLRGIGCKVSRPEGMQWSLPQSLPPILSVCS